MRATTLCSVLTLAAPLLMATTASAKTTAVSAKTTGGWSTVDVTSNTSQILLDALSGGDAGYDKDGVGSTRVCFNSIKKIEQQVVSGMNYCFHIEGCQVSSTKLAGSCAASNDKETKCATPVAYVVRVFEQVWSDTLQVKNITKEHGEAADVSVRGDVSASVKASPNGQDDDNEAQDAPTPMSDEEKRQVDKWIAASDLNEFGDSKHVMYTGGTPLFNESTGKTIDRYDYILGKHPDRPWKTLDVLRASLLAVADESERDSDSKSAVRGRAHGLMSVIVSVGVLTVVIALVAGVKAKRTRRHFAYDSVRNREY